MALNYVLSLMFITFVHLPFGIPISITRMGDYAAALLIRQEQSSFMKDCIQVSLGIERLYIEHRV